MSQITPDPSLPADPTTQPGGAVVEPLASAEPPDGRSTRWVDHREARRAELVRAARKVVHHQGPDVSMDEIAAAANTSKSIVYRYFGDRSGLRVAVAEAVVAQIQVALEEALHASSTPRDGLRAMVGVYLEMIESSPNVYFFVTSEGSLEPGSPLGRFLDAVIDLFAAPFALALTAAGSPDGPGSRVLAETWASGAAGFVRGAGERWLRRAGEPDAPAREDFTAQVAAWLWAGPLGVLARDPFNPDPFNPDPFKRDPFNTNPTTLTTEPAQEPR